MDNEIKCGIEIHQQLDTNKLFCGCPSILRNDEPQFIIKRKLHAVKGETGEIDFAAKYEAEKDREFSYYGYDTVCLVELDEEPPHMINPEALQIALHVALHLNCNILPVSQIMRKIVIDGSNTSGFQRTVLIARNGYISTSFGKVGIESINLEEDAARIVTTKFEEENSIDDCDQTVYKLDRLGIPLVEIATCPDIKSASQAKEVALLLGDILRSCKVKRGIGTIRQDVNLSIIGHPRVEIKGFQDVKMFIETFNNEILRQKTMIEIHNELKKRNSKVIDKIIDLTEIFKNTECRFIKNCVDSNGKVFGFKLIGFNGILGKELYKNKRFGTEISDYAKISGINGIIHSDENLEKYNFSKNEIESLKQKLELKETDSFIIVGDEEKKAKKAIELAIKRANLQIDSVYPKEVRVDNNDGSTRFLRPMPGSSRMYPETDLPLLNISREIINHAKKTLPKLRSDIKLKLKEKGLNEEMIKLLTFENKLEDFEALLKIINDPILIIKTMIIIPREIATKEKIKNINESLTLDIIESVIEAIKNKKISKDQIKQVLTDIAKGKTFEKAIKIESVEISDLETEIAKLLKDKPGLSTGGYMGLVMEKFKGKVSGKQASEILNKFLKK
jgi:glutamyl-tRNA(Gln) amidotransferase subunit E